MQVKTPENYIQRPIRKVNIVFDLDDIFAPELTLEEFIALYQTTPHPPRYRIVTFEAVSCAEDLQPVLVSECGKCSKFVRRYQDHICCRRPFSVEF
ncbi:hypothetical protein [[Eubacterium] cellulosolvens]